jgi:excisionase family DNA binding protein
VPETAVYLNVSVRFVRRLVAERRIAFHHVGRHVRFALTDLDTWLATGRIEPLNADAMSSPPCSTASCTAPSYSTSTATPPTCATTTPAPTPSGTPPPETTTDHYSDHHPQVGAFDKQLWPISLSAIRLLRRNAVGKHDQDDDG